MLDQISKKRNSNIRKIEDLLNRLKNDNDINLTIDEIKLIYELDFDIEHINYMYKSLNHEARELRISHRYDDLCSVFGASAVAHTEDEINENTKVYVGDLSIVSSLPTYNLQYIYGNLEHVLQNKINNLENLERVYGQISLINIDNLNGLENLEYVENGIEVEYSNSLDGLESINGVKSLELRNIKSVDGLIVPSDIQKFEIWFDEMDIPNLYSNIRFENNIMSEIYLNSADSIIDIEFPSKVHLLDLSEVRVLDNVTLPSSCDYLHLENVEIMHINNFPSECLELYMNIKRHIDYCILPRELSFLNLSNLRSAKGLLLPQKITSKIYMNNIENFEGIYIPKSIVEIVHKHNSCIIPDSSIVNEEQYNRIKESIEMYQKNEISEEELNEVLKDVRTNKRKVKRRY